MNELLNGETVRWLAVGLDLAAKSVVILVLAGGLALAARRASAAARHLAWCLAMASLLALPVLSGLLPSWRLPMLPRAMVDDSFLAGLQLDGTAAGRGGGKPTVASDESGSTRWRDDFSPGPETLPVAPAQPALNRGHSGNEVNLPMAVSAGRSSPATWPAWLLGLWLAGALAAAAPLGLGHWLMWRRSRQARTVSAGPWTREVEGLRRELGLRRTVKLAQCERTVMPMTWGAWRPLLLLPADAEEWTDDRRRLVLLHELAHVQRWDCLTQTIARLAAALYWFNPLVWVAVWRMRVERERACDDLVLGVGARPSVYADELLQITTGLREPGLAACAAVGMARRSTLEGRLLAILDGTRNRRVLTRWTVLAAAVLLAVIVTPLAVLRAGSAGTEPPPIANEPLPPATESSGWPNLHPRVREFFDRKARQAHALAEAEGKPLPPLLAQYFDTARRGDWNALTNLYADIRQQAPRYQGTIAHTTTPRAPNAALACAAFETLVEAHGVFEQFAYGEPRYAEAFARDILAAVPPGSVFLGGTGPGRFLVTAFSANHATGVPCFTITQHALADPPYLAYLRYLYGGKIYIPTEQVWHLCNSEYLADAQRRLAAGQLKPGEDVRLVEGQLKVSGHVAVMAINARLAKVIFDRTPDRDFFVEESFPLDWMYPHLAPHQLIFKLHRQPLPELTDDMVSRDRDFWSLYTAPLIGGWLTPDTSVTQVCAFAEQVFARKDLSDFRGDPKFVGNDYACRMFAKLRSSIAGLYHWRFAQSKNAGERERMARAADYAFRQALALCPYQPEVVFRYVSLLVNQGRTGEALEIARVAELLDPANRQYGNLRAELERVHKQKPNAAVVAPHAAPPVPSPNVLADPGTNQFTLTTNRLAFRLVSDDPSQPADLLADPRAPDRKVRVLKEVLMDETAVARVNLSRDSVAGTFQINLKLTEAGTERFAEITGANVRRQLAVVFDGQLLMAPYINERIAGGRLAINGKWTEAEAEALGKALLRPEAPDHPLSGRVLDADGLPVAGARVRLIAEDQGAGNAGGGVERGTNRVAETTTDAEGRFTLATARGDTLLVEHKLGVAALAPIEVPADDIIRLSAWGRLEGVLWIGAKLGTDELVRVSCWTEKHFQELALDDSAMTDEQGRFAFERVPPCRVSVGHYIAVSDNEYAPAKSLPVQVTPGQTNRVTLGGTGRPVVGKFVTGQQSLLETGVADGTWLTSLGPPIPYPANFGRLSARGQQEWQIAWSRTPAGQVHAKALAAFRNSPECLRFAFRVQADGTFRIEDVPAGQYRLNALWYDKLSAQDSRLPKLLATCETEIQVPPMPGGRSDEPLDVGDLKWKSVGP